jgi:hypothetical protein
MKNTHQDNRLLAEALDLVPHSLIHLEEIFGCDTHLLDITEIELPSGSQYLDNYCLVT